MKTLVSLASALALIGGAALAAAPSAFLDDAIKGDNSEIMLGHLAEQKGATDGVRNFGQVLVQDHSTAKEQAASVAKGLGVAVPTEPMAVAVAERQKLDHLSGAAFDHEFVRYMVDDHRKDIAKFQKQAAAHDGPTSQLAQQQLPVLKKHLDIAEGLQSRGD